jgi:Epiplasmin protein
VIEYEEVVRNERVPIEKTITDYYAVETQVEYIRR